MLKFTNGDMFETDADIRINTVNCVGVMGKGVALQFKQRYPLMFTDYQRACQNDQVKPGHLHIWMAPNGMFVVNFPTKRHWRQPSRYEDIEAGLSALYDFLDNCGSACVTIPPLGCGNGGLDWSIVSKQIEEELSDLEAEIYVFNPSNFKSKK